MLRLLSAPGASIRLHAGWLSVALALFAAVACGSDDDSPRDDGGSSGGSDSSSNGGDSSSEGGEPASSGGSSGAGGGSSTPGDFSSVWQRESAEITYVDYANPAQAETHEIDIPAKSVVPGDDREVEMYQQFDGDRLVTYAYTEGESAYYKLSQPAQLFEDQYIVTFAQSTHLYTVEDGTLVDSTSATLGNSLVVSTTRFRKYEGEFPPSGWPSESVSYEAPEVQ